MKKIFFLLLSFAVCFLCYAQTDIQKPWTRWWWMGNAVDEIGIKKQLTQLHDAGFGGVEIVPIYGAIGFEDKYIKYLSPQWMKMLDYTVFQAKQLNMGVYISVGTGWPIGGSNVLLADAASKLIVKKYAVKANEKLNEKISISDNKQKDIAVLSALMAFTKNGNLINLINKIDEAGNLNFITNNDIEIIAAFTGKTKQVVKRAAPGGEGYTIDHFSKDATANYFKIFDTAFGNSSHGVSAFFNDSYEVYNADFTPNFFNEFEKRRGYDLKKYLNLFTSNFINDTVARLKSDYRETISNLMLENFSTVFTSWTNKRKTQSVNQAHGSPGNLLDLYSAFNIPECETFGSTAFAVKGLRRDSADIRNVEPDPVMLKFASSAAHAYKKKLTSCETFTWLGEHFKTSWSQCKPEVDQVFLSGINHVFYHGTTYSSADVQFPGWLFYAAVNFVPQNSLWPHLKGLNEYIKRCQNVLQAGIPNKNTVKIYWPVYDVWNNANGLDMPLQVHSIDKWLHPTNFYKDVKQLQQKGYEIDFVSDKMISNATLNSSDILIIPQCKLMPLSTLKNIVALAKKGNTIILQKLPQDIPGFFNLSAQRKIFGSLISSLHFSKINDSVTTAINNKIIITNNIENGINVFTTIQRETLTDLGLKFIKRDGGNKTYYFISNNTANDIDEKISLAVKSKYIKFSNPLNGNEGYVITENNKVRVQLKSGQSIIAIANNNIEPNALQWKYIEPDGNIINLQYNNWKLHFTEGGPYLPSDKNMQQIQPWTNFIEDSTTQYFSGTGVYTTTVNLKNKAADYLLQFDKLFESAKIIINGKDAGLVWSLPFEIKIGKFLKEGNNTISIEVCNLMANRIRYMDQHKIIWRNYHEINFVNINYKNFDASNWKVQPSGVDGFVNLIPLK